MTLLWGLTLLSLASQDTARIRSLLDIEDSRPRSLAALAPLVGAAASNDTLLARWAVRGLGRQQRADLISTLGRALASEAPTIRLEAVNAIGQSAVWDSLGEARRLLQPRVSLETDPEVLGALLRTLGRIPTSDWNRTEQLLVRASQGTSGDLAPAVLEGAAMGLASLYRQADARQQASITAYERLAWLINSWYPVSVRRRAMAALVSSGRTDSVLLLRAMKDPEREVRRLALLSTFLQPRLDGREGVVRLGWTDSDPSVRYEALRAYARHLSQQQGCGLTISALEDTNLHVTLLAIDLLGACGSRAGERLASIAREPITPAAWHRPAHALVALARADSSRLTGLLPAFITSPVWWARLYGARAAEAAGPVGLIPELMALARDPHPNVRETALTGLRRRVGHAADSLYLAALNSPDYQLLQTAAKALDSSPHPRAVEALGAAFARVTREKRETSRDPRIAMLESIEHIGSAPLATALRDATKDFDSTVAATAARIGTRWTANNLVPAPEPLPRQPIPSWSDLAAWDKLTAVITMKGGGIVRMKLRPFEAPTNVARFVRMVRSGWFNGLTWHRVAPNFVVQGGSPGPNEYMGDGPFTRDELGLGSHVRGTVGISTRGRDTGDGQLFFNLIDNWRLDHDYTIIGEVVQGMNVVDAWQEGAVIERIELVGN